MTAALVATGAGGRVRGIAVSGAASRDERDERRLIADVRGRVDASPSRRASLVRASRAFDRADRLQGRLLRPHASATA